ncbi:MAG: glutamine-hydrolyzing carbamoyl-phosphate synthase small subunit, partial [Chloroflexi bacterium]|nr:glutamine-hydrolyzing carbamoyl-phosphate synthase small subunit [Chloroflexota bacterium]
MAERAILALEDGRVFRGYRFGANLDSGGEVVFTTSMTGYQEICTDPSYRAQIVCLTYPIIGNYGVTAGDTESRQPWLAGLVVREYCAEYSNWRATGNLDEYLRQAGVPGIYGVDTRALTRHIRSLGSRRGIITSELNEAEAVERAGEVLWPAEQDVVAQVGTRRAYDFGSPSVQPALRLVVIDCGLKENILRSLARRGVETTVVPYEATIEEILALQPDGVLSSPGPGDPQNATPAIKTIGQVLETGLPFFGICLGHQLLALALGATTRRLKFGHRGGEPSRDGPG